MQETIVEIEPNIFSDLERIQLEMALIEDHPLEVCAFCGSDHDMVTSEVRSDLLRRPIELPICGTCSELIKEKNVEEFLDLVEKQNSSLWSKMIVNNMRKTNWISKMVFAQLKSKRM